jgi:hypothetical protein
MTGNDIETRLRHTLQEMADLAPLVNPEGARKEGGSQAQRRSPHGDYKTMTLVGGLLVLFGLLIAFAVEDIHHAPPRLVPAATTTSASTTTSLPPSGPYVVPNVVGLTLVQAADELQMVGLTNSIDNLNCPGSSGYGTVGHVVDQNPPAGSRVASDSRVNLQISCTGDPTPTTTTPPG